MRNKILLFFVFIALLASIPSELSAEHFWAIAKMESESSKPTIVDYHSMEEVAANGITYQRIYDDGYRTRHEAYNPIKLPYGYKLDNKKIYIFDFENQKEVLAFDFTLSEGDVFTTYNGMKWTIISEKDTLVKINEMEKIEYITKRLFHVRTLDSQFFDQWLEDFGSFSNHLMIDSVEKEKGSQLLWFEYDYGQYITREIQADPFFTHDTGWLIGIRNEEHEERTDYANCIYADSTIVFKKAQFSWPYREYSCYYREGNDIYRLYSWELEPHVDVGEYGLIEDVTTFKGVPVPSSGNYVVHLGNHKYGTKVHSVYNNLEKEEIYYDIYGRRLKSHQKNGLFIKINEVNR